MATNPKRKSLQDLFVHALKDVYYAEKAIAAALPRMAAKAKHDELKAAIETHLEETRVHAQRLEKVFDQLGLEPASVKCEAIDGVLKEGDEILEDFADGPACDAGVVFAAQAVEHYEITRYGSLLAWAKALKLAPVADLLKATLDEEYIADDKLTRLAETRENRQGIVGKAAAIRAA
jgi:ferritin-like metal-binding protein YciE